MKTLTLFIVFLFAAANAIAHGSIEKIECKNLKNKVLLTGKGTPKANELSFHLEENGQVILTNELATIDFEDTAENNKIYENLRFSFKNVGKAHLKILEDYKIKLRPGTGLLELTSKNKTHHLECTVNY